MVSAGAQEDLKNERALEEVDHEKHAYVVGRKAGQGGTFLRRLCAQHDASAVDAAAFCALGTLSSCRPWRARL